MTLNPRARLGYTSKPRTSRVRPSGGLPELGASRLAIAPARPGLWFAFALLFACTACESGSAPTNADRRVPAPTVAAPSAVAPTTKLAVEDKPAAHVDPPPPSRGVEWKGNVEWHGWDEGLVIAARESKPIMVLVYADWCPHCRALGPVFADPEIEALASHLVMVRQNHDDNPAWLQPFDQKYGAYVPRIFFFDSNGKIREDLTSGHPRYPYFYAAQAVDLLKRSMRRAIGS